MAAADPEELGRRLREGDRSAAPPALNLIEEWRGAGRTVAVLAVDPSSKRSGGSLLGDRARIDHDPKDDGILIRSTAAGGRLRGLGAAPPGAGGAAAPAVGLG